MNSPPQTRDQATIKTVGWVIATSFWDASGKIYINYSQGRRTVTCQYYVTLLKRFNEKNTTNFEEKVRLKEICIHG